MRPRTIGRAAQLAQASADRLALRMFVKALRVEAYRSEGDEDEQEPLKLGERGNVDFKHAEFGPHISQPMGGPKRGDQQKRVNDLEELQIEFLTATKHCRDAGGIFYHYIHLSGKPSEKA